MSLSLYEVLSAHAERYPKMQLFDAVKLVYQNEFGGGHLVKDSRESFRRLKTEFVSIVPAAGCSLTEDIGNGLKRLNLRALDRKKLPLERLNDIFVMSANEVGGSVDSYIVKLDTLRQVTAENRFMFSLDELNAFLFTHEKAGYPAVSHSDTYRLEYKPAYRVVLGKYCDWSSKDATHR